MCYALYLASERPLPTIPWDERRRALNVSETGPRDEAVARHFTKPHRYYVGSHLRCGCGFFTDTALAPDSDEKETIREVERSLSQLRDYLREALKSAGELELYVAWEGEKDKDPLRRVRLTGREIESGLDLAERHFYLIGREDDRTGRNE